MEELGFYPNAILHIQVNKWILDIFYLYNLLNNYSKNTPIVFKL